VATSSFVSSASTGSGGVSAPVASKASLFSPTEMSKVIAPEVAVKRSIEYITATAWDIKDAFTHRKKRKQVNECHYWIYEISTDGYTHERFRKDKDCDEFEFNFVESK
jgi:hypothetical protein